MDVKSTVLVAYTQNVPPAHSRGYRPFSPADRERPEAHQVSSADDIVDIYEAEAAPETTGATVRINLKTPEYDTGGYRRLPVRGSLIDTWA